VVRSHLRDGDAVGVLGLSYKPGTPVVEESAGVALAGLLAETGAHEVHVFDPVATEAAVERLGTRVRTCRSLVELVERSDVVVITTPWRDFASLPLERRDGRRLVVVDCWRQLANVTHGDAVEIVPLGRPLETSVA
jgi:UDPglucose 6-dehydrogenase